MIGIESTRPLDLRRARHVDTRNRIIAIAWELAREVGLGGISLHEIARRVGMRQPSLYSYFASKHDLYDAMFAQGNEQLIAMTNALRPSGSARSDLHDFVVAFGRFAVRDPARYLLLFQRTLPGYEPSAEAYASAQEFYASVRRRLVDLGLPKTRQMDMFVSIVAGPIDAQLANEPGGDRWLRLLPEIVDMFLDHHGTTMMPRAQRRPKGRTR